MSVGHAAAEEGHHIQRPHGDVDDRSAGDSARVDVTTGEGGTLDRSSQMRPPLHDPRRGVDRVDRVVLRDDKHRISAHQGLSVHLPIQTGRRRPLRTDRSDRGHWHDPGPRVVSVVRRPISDRRVPARGRLRVGDQRDCTRSGGEHPGRARGQGKNHQVPRDDSHQCNEHRDDGLRYCSSRPISRRSGEERARPCLRHRSAVRRELNPAGSPSGNIDFHLLKCPSEADDWLARIEPRDLVPCVGSRIVRALCPRPGSRGGPSCSRA